MFRSFCLLACAALVSLLPAGRVVRAQGGLRSTASAVLVASGNGGVCQIACFFAVTTAGEWASLKRQFVFVGPKQTLPRVNFRRTSAVVVNVGHYDYINAVDMRTRARGIRVSVEYTPGPTGIQPAPFNHPYRIYVIPRSTSLVQFWVTAQVRYCPADFYVACGQPEQAQASGGVCTHSASAYMVATCYAPDQKQTAEHRVSFSPVDPSTAVRAATGLTLRHIAVLSPVTPAGTVQPAIRIEYLYGRIPSDVSATTSRAVSDRCVQVIESIAPQYSRFGAYPSYSRFAIDPGEAMRGISAPTTTPYEVVGYRPHAKIRIAVWSNGGSGLSRAIATHLVRVTP